MEKKAADYQNHKASGNLGGSFHHDLDLAIKTTRKPRSVNWDEWHFEIRI